MKVNTEHAAAVEQARNHGRSCAMRAHNAGLEPSFVGHAYMAEAMRMFFNCDHERAIALASGLMVIAFADERSAPKDGSVLAEYILMRSVNNPEVVDRFRSLAGLNNAAPLAER